MAQSKSWLEPNWTLMARLVDCSSSTIPIKLGRTRAILTRRMGEDFTISLCRAGRDLPKKTHISHCFKRCFHQIPTEGAEHFYNQWIFICTGFLQVFQTCNLLQLEQCFVWSHQLWIKKFIWKNSFYIIRNSSKCGFIGRSWMLSQASVLAKIGIAIRKTCFSWRTQKV